MSWNINGNGSSVFILEHPKHQPARVQCFDCKAVLGYWKEDIFETYEDTGPYEVECPRDCIRCSNCKKLIDVPKKNAPTRPPLSKSDEDL